MKHKISYVNTKDLIPYANNSRTHSDEQVNQIASSINEFGFTNPILIDDKKSIIAGHSRVMAANKLGLEQVPTIELAGLTKAQIKAYVIADNQLALNAGWDIDTLRLEIEHLKEVEFDLDLLGFDDNFLLTLFDVNEELELKEESYSEVFNIIVECNDELDQEAIYHDLIEKGYKCQVQSL